MERTYFREEQRFTQYWLWVLLVLVITAVLLPIFAALYAELIEGRSFGENPSSTATLLIMFFMVAGLSSGILVLFWRTKLVTVVNKDGISLRFPPFFSRERKFEADSIAEYYIRQYKPIREYGGWGIRLGLTGYGRAYNVKGKTGLQLVFKNGKGLLIGTQRSAALMRAMNKMMGER